VHGTGEVFGSIQSALDKRFVDHHLGGDISEFTSLPRFYLLSHWLDILLHPVDTDRDAVDQ